MHFASTLVTPITSNTARMGPPAMMPVPSEAGCMITFEEPCLPITACCSVPFFRDTRNILRRASSRAFWTATGTSRALPLPMPTAPSPSPTTVSAAKPRIRPPFTTLVTRFTETIFSFRPSERCSPPCILGCILAIVIPLECSPKSGLWEEDLPFVADLELEAGLSRGVCQRFDPAVILVAGAVERDGLDAQTFRFLGDTPAYRDRRRLVAAVRDRGAHFLLHRLGGAQHFSVHRAQLGVDLSIGSMHSQPHLRQFTDFSARLRSAPKSCRFFVDHRGSLLLLGFLQDHPLVGVAHTLALVRLGRPVGAHLGGDLSYELLVQPLDHDFGLRGSLDLHPFGHGVHDGMRKTQRKVQLVHLRLRAIADPDQRQPLLETLCDSEHHVGGERPQRSRHGVGLVRILESLQYQLVAVLLDADVAAQPLRQRSQRPFDREGFSCKRRLDALG